MLLFPRIKLRGMDTPIEKADPLAVQGLQIRHGNIGIHKVRIQQVFLLTHRQFGEQHGLGTLIRIGNAAHQVEFPVFHHLQQLRPAGVYIFIIPPRIGGYRLLVLVTISTPLSVLPGDVVGILKPSHLHRFRFCLLRRDAHRQQENHTEKEQKTTDSSVSFFLLLDHLSSIPSICILSHIRLYNIIIRVWGESVNEIEPKKLLFCRRDDGKTAVLFLILCHLISL